MISIMPATNRVEKRANSFVGIWATGGDWVFIGNTFCSVTGDEFISFSIQEASKNVNVSEIRLLNMILYV
jgi:hypothetical protein